MSSTTSVEPPPSVEAALVCHVDELPIGAGRTFSVAGRQVALFRTRAGTVHALDAVCPHRGGPIADGQADTSVVICPLHAHVFELATGVCRTGQPSLPVFAAYVDEAGLVHVAVP